MSSESSFNISSSSGERGKSSHRRSRIEGCAHPLQEFKFALRELSFLAGGFRAALGFVPAFFDGLQVFQAELGIDDIAVAGRVHRALHVGHVVIDETAQHVQHRIDFADVGEELVSESFTEGGTADESGDVDKLKARRDDALRFDERGDALQSLVGHRHHADVRLNGGEGIVRCERTGVRQCVEERGFADVRESDDAKRESHAPRL